VANSDTFEQLSLRCFPLFQMQSPTIDQYDVSIDLEFGHDPHLAGGPSAIYDRAKYYSNCQMRYKKSRCFR
jgi:hypothetical protein